MDVLRLFFERSAAVQQFWTFYLTVSIGFVAFFGAAKRTKAMAVFMSVGFLAFAVVNGTGMRDAAEQRVQACSAVAHKTCDIGPITITSPVVITVDPASVLSVTVFHIGMDILVLAAIWYLAIRATKPQVTDVRIIRG